MEGIDATKAVLADATVIVPKLIQRAKDGVGVDDVMALALDADFRQAVQNLVDNAKKLPAEASDLTIEEGVQLVDPAVKLILAIINSARAA